MDKFPLMWQEKVVGDLVTEREVMYTWFSVRGRLPQNGLWCAWVVGERGELKLGILEPLEDCAVIRRRFSHPMTAHLGRILRGELRPAMGTATGQWEGVAAPESLFRTPWISQQLRGHQGISVRRNDENMEIAIPYDSGRPFPLPALFCFAREEHIGQKRCLVFTFGPNEMPVLKKCGKN